MRVFSENKNKRSLWQKKTLPKGLQFAVCNFAARRLTSSSEHFQRNSSDMEFFSLRNSEQLNSWIYSLNLIYSESKHCKLFYMSMSIMIQDPVSSSFPLHFLCSFFFLISWWGLRGEHCTCNLIPDLLRNCTDRIATYIFLWRTT